MAVIGNLTFLLERPTALIDEARVKANIAAMIKTAEDGGVRLRPHVKTHISADIALWLKDAGISGITVSSVQMAEYFADNGWEDITIAVPANLLEIPRMSALAGKIKLGLLADSAATIEALANGLEHPADLWLKIDVGYHRVGIHWKESLSVLQCAHAAKSAENLNLAGLLTHAGHTYESRSKEEIIEIANESIRRIAKVQHFLLHEDFGDLQVSYGDTPSCSVLREFPGVDEIRPGNFTFYDLVQEQIGSCKDSQIALAVACPVIGVYPDRKQVVIYGGGVHLSKDSILVDKKRVYGYLMTITGSKFGKIIRKAPLVSISQEHGILDASGEVLNQVKVGDIILIAPAHSCLAADMHDHFLNTNGKRIERFSK